MASLARGREACLRVRRITGLVEVCQMTAHAGGWRSHKLSVYVAGGAIEIRVSSSQSKSGELKMVKLCAHPVVHRVALFATGGQIQLHVIEAGGPGIDEISLMARVARGREALELPHSRIFVAGVAIQCCMRTDQREAVDVLINLLNRDIPTFHRMALFAICSHLPLVNVGMAIRALGSHIRKDQLGMALRAAHALVHAAQGISRSVVIEFRDRAYRLPPAQRVAILAGNT
jgi:hypothetical protein